jgi:hypothetical protein
MLPRPVRRMSPATSAVQVLLARSGVRFSTLSRAMRKVGPRRYARLWGETGGPQ